MKYSNQYEKVKKRINYFQEAVKIQGRDKNDKENKKQAGYSLLWFYDAICEDKIKINQLTSAFLGNTNDLEVLKSQDNSTQHNQLLFIEDINPPNKSQKDAIERALYNPVSIIHGPPGTGKTETILHIVYNVLADKKNVAIVSKNSAALDNITHKVKKISSLLPLYAKLGNAGVRNDWWNGKRKEKDGRDWWKGEGKRRWNREGKCQDLCFEFIGYNDDRLNRKLGPAWEPSIIAESFLEKYPFITSTVHSLLTCFANGLTFQYDYVIIDEASQCDLITGLVAMNCAEHLVIVGDQEQLSPIIDNDFYNELNNLDNEYINDISESIRIKDSQSNDGQSILVACKNGFVNNEHITFLNEHYRCHPGIIGFCNKEIYSNYKYNNRCGLDIKTKNNGIQTPIKILWYEGDYCEGKKIKNTVSDDKESKTTKNNMKQVTIFMQEEWPYICGQIYQNNENNKDNDEEKQEFSVCILSPFKGLLISIKEAIDNDNTTNIREVELTDISGESLNEKKKRKNVEGTLVSIDPEMLTIHKSQGQEFDLVYLLPVEDGDWEWPWSQGKKLINVAVSRAKKELRLIISSCLLNNATQIDLVGEKNIVPPRSGNQKNETELNLEKSRQRFIQKLTEYVKDRTNPKSEHYLNEIGYPKSDNLYGFHKTKYVSIFDKIPIHQIDENGQRISRYVDNKNSAPEKCLEDALKTMSFLKDNKLCYQKAVKLSELCFTDIPLPVCIPEDRYVDIKEFAEKIGTHFDFVIYEENTKKVIIAVEVDGAFHRFPNKNHNNKYNWEALQTQQTNDNLKNDLVKFFGATILYTNNEEVWVNGKPDNPTFISQNPTFILLRLPSDGSTYSEVRALQDNPDAFISIKTIEDIIEHQLRNRHNSFFLSIIDNTNTSLHNNPQEIKNNKIAEDFLKANIYHLNGQNPSDIYSGEPGNEVKNHTQGCDIIPDNNEQDEFENADVTDDVRDILECVKQLPAQYGVTMIIDVLRGSANKKIMNLKYNELSVYGISKKNNRSKDILFKVIEKMLSENLLTRKPVKHYGDNYVIERGGSADDFIKNGKHMDLLLRRNSIGKQVADEKPYDIELFDILRELRIKLANSISRPAFCVFSDKTLRDMCRKKPKTKEELLCVNGVGIIKIEQYGNLFLNTINEYMQVKEANQQITKSE